MSKQINIQCDKCKSIINGNFFHIIIIQQNTEYGDYPDLIDGFGKKLSQNRECDICEKCAKEDGVI